MPVILSPKNRHLLSLSHSAIAKPSLLYIGSRVSISSLAGAIRFSQLRQAGIDEPDVAFCFASEKQNEPSFGMLSLKAA